MTLGQSQMDEKQKFLVLHPFVVVACIVVDEVVDAGFELTAVLWMPPPPRFSSGKVFHPV